MWGVKPFVFFVAKHQAGGRGLSGKCLAVVRVFQGDMRPFHSSRYAEPLRDRRHSEKLWDERHPPPRGD